LTNDRILQARVFSYNDTARHRLGSNFDQIPVNCPMSGTNNYIRDGFMSVKGNGGSSVNYEPNSLNGPVEDKKVLEKPFPVKGCAKKQPFVIKGDDFEQPRAFWTKVFKEENRAYLVNAMSGNMKTCRSDIKERMIALCAKVHPDFGQRLADSLGMKFEKPHL